MLIELSQLPQSMQQYILNEQAGIVQIVNNGQVIKALQLGEPVVDNDEAEYIDFDIERMKQAIGETDSNGRAVHTKEVPDWALVDLASFDKWLRFDDEIIIVDLTVHPPFELPSLGKND